LASLHWHDYGEHWFLVALTVGLSLGWHCRVGDAFGGDVAVSPQTCRHRPSDLAAPFVATLVDVTGLVIYFSVASLVLRDTLL